jgi:hypothetical protein
LIKVIFNKNGTGFFYGPVFCFISGYINLGFSRRAAYWLSVDIHSVMPMSVFGPVPRSE